MALASPITDRRTWLRLMGREREEERGGGEEERIEGKERSLLKQPLRSTKHAHVSNGPRSSRLRLRHVSEQGQSETSLYLDLQACVPRVSCYPVDATSATLLYGTKYIFNGTRPNKVQQENNPPNYLPVSVHAWVLSPNYHR